MQRGRRIAFDYGDVRIGVAVSDPESILAIPLVTLKSSDKNLAKEVAKIFNEIEPVAVYLGRPALLSGQDGAATEINGYRFNFVEDFRNFFGQVFVAALERY